MRRLYAGYPELMQDATFDVEQFFSDWEHALRSAGPAITFGEGVLRYLVGLRRHIRDNHLFVWGRARQLVRRDDLMFSEYQARRKVEPFDGAHCAFGEVTPVPETARVTPRFLPTLASPTSRRSRHSRPLRRLTSPAAGRRSASSAASRGRRAQTRTLRRTRRGPSATPRSSFVRALAGDPKAQALLAQIAADYGKHKKKPIIVFDFRGNGGGNDGYIYSWVEKAKRGVWPLPDFEVSVTGAARACGEWNDSVADQISFDRVDSPEGNAEREAFRAKTPLGDVRGAPTEKSPSVTSVTSNATSPYSGRIFVLADAASASSGETSPDELRTALGATVVGERTAGFLEFGNVYPYAMPRTGILWELGSKRNYYTEPRDGVGIPVDVYLDDDLVEAPIRGARPLAREGPKERSRKSGGVSLDLPLFFRELGESAIEVG